MKIATNNASKLFFPNTSLEFVYFEAIANSIDAGAKHISINIEISSFTEVESLKITITDDGEGFNDRNFEKFNKVLAVDDDKHKGIGRLVYLNYFQNIHIESKYGKRLRKFVFNDSFDGECKITDMLKEEYETKLIFTNYVKDRVKKYDYLIAETVRNSIHEHFLPKFYQMKLDKKKLIIKISLITNTPNSEYDFNNGDTQIDISKLPDLKEKSIPDKSTFFGVFRMLYSIEKSIDDQSVISALCADDRTISMPIISNKDFPIGYKMVFILYSDYLNGKTNSTRENLNLDESVINKLKRIFTQLISEVVKEEIPEIIKSNEKVKEKLQTQYPHLLGLFDEDSIGLADKTSIVNSAQQKYFNEQKEILEATELSDEQFEKSLEFSSRILTEYVLYRTKIIQKLKTISAKNDEAEIHDLIVPRKQKLYSNDNYENLFINNSWILDDKYMSYSKVLSDIDIEKIYSELDVKG